jgi:6-phosphogluconolactonase (cycloisomerase 2 family)
MSLYVVDAADATISQYDVDPTGALSPKVPATIATGASPGDIAVSPDGTSLYLVHGGFGGSVSLFDIDPQTGLLAPKSPPSVPTGSLARQAALTPDGSSLYVVTGSQFGGGAVFQYDVDAPSGALSPKDPAMVTTRYCQRVCTSSTGVGIAITPDGESAYVTDVSTNAVVQFDVDPFTGELSPKFPIPVQTGDPPLYAPAGTTPLAIDISPDGRSAYVANRGDHAISQYDIDPATGALTAKTPVTIPTGDDPVALVVSTDGTSLYATNSADNTVSQYDIEPTTGTLSAKTPSTIAAGTFPAAIATAAPKLATTTALTCAPDNVVARAATTCTAVVAGAGGTPVPAGTVRFDSDSSGTFVSSACVLEPSGTSAACEVEYTPSTIGTGSHTLQARYLGSSAHRASRGRNGLSVAGRATAISVTCFPTPFVVDNAAECAATIVDTEPAGTPTTPTGDGAGSFSSTVTASYPNGPICNVQPVDTVSAACSQNVTFTSPGTGHMTLHYAGDATHAPRSGNTAITVEPPATTVSLDCSPNALRIGQTTSCTATVAESQTPAGETPATGTVRFTSNVAGDFSPVPSCTLTTTGNAASCDVQYTPTAYGSGTHTLTASYEGDDWHAASATSTFLTLTNPFITSLVPFDGDHNVPRNAGVAAFFNEPMNKQTAQSAFSLKRATDGATVTGTFAWSGNVLLFQPAAPFAMATTYTATITTAAQDLDGNPLPATRTTTFTITFAEAGPNQTVASGSRFTLDGSGSTHPGHEPLTYHWQQFAGPEAVIDDRTRARPQVTAPAGPATLQFRLTVTDTSGQSTSDTVVVTVKAPK